MTTVSRKNKFDNKWLHIGLLVVAIAAVYANVFHAGFLAWDDGDYVQHNKDISGITGEHISHWFSNFYIGNYQPITMLSYALDYLLGGKGPFVYHLTNIILHSVNTVILYFFINKLQPSSTVGFFVALFFAVHPVQSESVAWIAERKTLLCAFFYFMAMLQYVAYVHKPGFKKIVVVFLLAIAAMLSKGVGVSLPMSLFAIDVWLHRDLMDKTMWLEKIPFKIVGIIVGIVAIRAQASEHALGMHAEDSFFKTVMFASDAYVQYIVRVFVPVNLSVIYPYPKDVSWVEWVSFMVAIDAVTLTIISWRKKWFVLCGGIIFYTVNIALVLQFIQFGETLTADRYLYVAGVGIFFPLAYYLHGWLVKMWKEITAQAVLALMGAGLMVMTFVRNDVWLSDMKFFSAIVQTFPNSAVAQYSLGALYIRMGQYDEAEPHIDMAIRLDPNSYKAWYNKGIMNMRQGHAMEALDAYNRCLAIKDYTKAYFSRAMLYESNGKPELAIPDIDRVLAEQPQNARAYYIKADCIEQQGDLRAALDNYNKAIEYAGDDPLFFIRRGLLKAKTNQVAAALIDLDKAVSLNPGNGEALYYRGLIKSSIGQDPCSDLHNAFKYGYKQAHDAIVKFCGS